MADITLAQRLDRIKRLEDDLVHEGMGIIGAGADLSYADFFVFGALRRTLAQARGFRDLVTSRNFPCAAAILRLQLDTAMRINALSSVEDVDAACKAVIEGEQFNRLKDLDGNKLSDFHLRKKLAEKHPWISPVYERTSEFVHLSGKHFEISIARTDDEKRIAYFQLSGEDPHRPDQTYFEAVDTFFEVTRLAGMLLLGFWRACHQADEVLASIPKDVGLV